MPVNSLSESNMNQKPFSNTNYFLQRITAWLALYFNGKLEHPLQNVCDNESTKYCYHLHHALYLEITQTKMIMAHEKMFSFVLICIWTASSEFGTYHLCEQRRSRRACASAQSRQNLRCSLIQAVNQEDPSDRKPDAWPLWMAGHAQLKFVMTECSKTQIRLTGLIYFFR